MLAHPFQTAFFVGAGWFLAGLLRDITVSAMNSAIMFVVSKRRMGGQ